MSAEVAAEETKGPGIDLTGSGGALARTCVWTSLALNGPVRC